MLKCKLFIIYLLIISASNLTIACNNDPDKNPEEVKSTLGVEDQNPADANKYPKHNAQGDIITPIPTTTPLE